MPDYSNREVVSRVSKWLTFEGILLILITMGGALIGWGAFGERLNAQEANIKEVDSKVLTLEEELEDLEDRLIIIQGDIRVIRNQQNNNSQNAEQIRQSIKEIKQLLMQ